MSVGKPPTETWFGQKLSRIVGATYTTDLDLQVDFQGHLKVKLSFLNRNSYF